MAESTPNTQAPGAPEPAATDLPAPVSPEAPKPGDKPADDFKSPESKTAVLADLVRERDARQALEAKLTQFESATAERNKALAEALGLAEAPKSEDLAATVKGLQDRIDNSEREATRLRIAAEKEVPAAYHYLLTETDTEKLTAQAEMAAEYARLKAQAEGTPQFQANPGQGQGGTPGTPEAIAAAEYAKYYPEEKRP